MKTFLITLFFLLAMPNGNSSSRINDCKFKGKKLYGRVKIVNAFPDFKVKIVDAFPDLKVKVVNTFPDKCGLWQFVDSFEDFTIMFVDCFEDFSIKYVDAFPGMP